MSTRVLQHGKPTDTIVPGIYQHFKGNRYRVIDTALLSETKEPVVIYEALYGSHQIWVRPVEMWNDVVAHEGEAVKRMTLMSSDSWGY